MDSGDPIQDINRQQNKTFSKSPVPLIGGLIDYMDTSVDYFKGHLFNQASNLYPKSRDKLSATFLAAVCLILGFVCNVKLEVVTVDKKPLPNDMHVMVLDKNEKLYVDEIDTSHVLWCVEASDFLVLVISCILIWNSSRVRSPLSEYLFLPWMGVTLRGLFTRQVPTAGALMYTTAVINGRVNPLFITAFSFLFLLEARVWLEIARLVRMRWEKRNQRIMLDSQREVETLFSNTDDGLSIERSPLSEYLFLPWMGVTLRGLFTRQVPTAGALMYTTAVINGRVNPLLITAFSFLLLLEARVWLEIARLVRMRWEKRNQRIMLDSQREVETLFGNTDYGHSIEVNNFVY